MLPKDNTHAIPAPYGFVLSHVVVDEIWTPTAPVPTETLGGAGIHAAVGQALAFDGAGIVVLVSGVGTDFPETARRDMEQAGIDHSGLVAVHKATPRTVIRYQTETVRTERPAFGLKHFQQSDPRPSMVPQSRRNPDAVYVFAGVTEPAWGVIDELDRNATVLWELDASICDPRHSDAIRARAQRANLVSLNEQELCGLSGGSSRAHLRRAVRELFPAAQAVALRCGERGALLTSHDHIWAARPQRDQPVVDPTGAGNAFSGALAAAWTLFAGDPARALQASMAAAAITVGCKGPALPITAGMRTHFTRLMQGQTVETTTWNEQEETDD